MNQVRNSLALIIAVLLQWTLARLAMPFVFVDFTLLLVVYVALKREALRAMIYATIAGVAVDALSGGLLGASGFSKTITAFAVAEVARRVLLLDNALLRIPIIACASLLNSTIYYAMHQLLGQSPISGFAETVAYSAIGTTAVGTVLMLILDTAFSERARSMRRAKSQSTQRRYNFRRSQIKLGKRV